MAQALIDAARSRAGKLYLGLDVSTQSTGYAVLRPSTVPPSTSEPEGLLREAGEANLVEWGCILGSSNGSKKDVVDVGIIVEEALVEVATRCRRDNGYNGRDRELSAEQGVGADGASGAWGVAVPWGLRLEGTGSYSYIRVDACTMGYYEIVPWY